VIVGGPGAWQIEHKGVQDDWGIDTLVHGEAEAHVESLFQAAVRGEALPRRIECHSPPLEAIPTTHNRSTFGV